jgi:hypothetical protein
VSVSIILGKRHALAGLFLFVFGCLVVGAFLAPAASQAVASTYTRSASCAGLDFYPADSRTEYDNVGPMRVWRSGDTGNAGSGFFRCDPGLPTGAVVKQVQFTALLQSGDGMSDCALRRSGLTTTTATTNDDLGRVSFAGGSTNGVVRLTDSSISNGTIDNTKWGYWLECSFNSGWAWSTASPSSGLFGADVIYTITAAKG